MLARLVNFSWEALGTIASLVWKLNPFFWSQPIWVKRGLRSAIYRNFDPNIVSPLKKNKYPAYTLPKHSYGASLLIYRVVCSRRCMAVPDKIVAEHEIGLTLTLWISEYLQAVSYIIELSNLIVRDFFPVGIRNDSGGIFCFARASRAHINAWNETQLNRWL